MAEVVRFSSSYSFRFSSPSPSFSSSTSSSSGSSSSIMQLGFVPIHQKLNERVSAVTYSAAARTCLALPLSFVRPRTEQRRPSSFKVNAAIAESEQPKWWEKNAGSNMIDINSAQDFLSALSQAGDRLVIVEFYGTWCASCRALFPKLCRTAEEHSEILFLKVNFDANKPMCKSLNVKVLPYFHFYRGADGQVDAFSCSLAKFQKIKDAIELYNTAPFCNGPPKGVGDLKLELTALVKDAESAAS